MVKWLNEAFNEENYEELQDVKGDRSWREAILEEFGVKE